MLSEEAANAAYLADDLWGWSKTRLDAPNGGPALETVIVLVLVCGVAGAGNAVVPLSNPFYATRILLDEQRQLVHGAYSASPAITCVNQIQYTSVKFMLDR